MLEMSLCENSYGVQIVDPLFLRCDKLCGSYVVALLDRVPVFNRQVYGKVCP